MKKTLLFALSVALVAGTMTSCGKSSKGKMDGEWKISDFTTTSTNTSGGSTDTETITLSGTTITQTSTSGGSTSTSNGVLNSATWTISKDGTWTRAINVTFTTTILGTDFITTSVMTDSGKWDFLKGVGDDFKKNERVAFYTLNSTTTDTYTGGSSGSDTYTSTYKDGENSEVFVISESKKKSLILTFDQGGSWTSGGSTSSDTETGTWTLIQE